MGDFLLAGDLGEFVHPLRVNYIPRPMKRARTIFIGYLLSGIFSPQPAIAALALQDPAALQEEEQKRKQDIAELIQKVFATTNPKEKERHYRRILELDPYHAGAIEGLADVQRQIQETEQQHQVRREKEKRKSEAIEAARHAYVAGDLAQAREKIDVALAIDPEDPEAKTLKGHIEDDIRNQKITRIVLWSLLALLLLGLLIFLLLRLRKRAGLLELIEGGEPGQFFPLEKETTTLGSLEAEVDCVLPDPNRKISRRHCGILRSGKNYFLTDYSTNGTIINGHEVPKGELVLLRPGDRISLAGEITLRFRYK